MLGVGDSKSKRLTATNVRCRGTGEYPESLRISNSVDGKLKADNCAERTLSSSVEDSWDCFIASSIGMLRGSGESSRSKSIQTVLLARFGVRSLSSSLPPSDD